ncbi:MAG TPA: hypothetical protein VHE35_36625 [Kofleriaceae bacterium]|nr:hypothetical protein [Kofleriaceae bacterium]
MRWMLAALVVALVASAAAAARAEVASRPAATVAAVEPARRLEASAPGIVVADNERPRGSRQVLFDLAAGGIILVGLRRVVVSKARPALLARRPI